MSRNENQVDRTRKPPCPRKESVTGGTHDGTAGQAGERREERHRSKQPTVYSLSLSPAGWPNRVRGGYGAEFGNGRLYSIPIVCRCPEGRENLNGLLSTDL